METTAITRKMRQPPETGNWFGIRSGERGTHTSRTVMLKELGELLRFTSQTAESSEYRAAIIDENVLGKRTLATRKLTAQRLSELYGLDGAVPIFRVLRQLWDLDPRGRPLLAFIVAFARDPLLRMTSELVLSARIGEPVRSTDLDAALHDQLGSRLKPAVRQKVARNVASSWTQSGHLHGRSVKIRSKPVASPTSTAMALLLGYVIGLRGQAVFGSDWARLLDVGHLELSQLARTASRMNLLDFRQAVDLVEIRFPNLLRPYEEAHCRV